MSAPNLPYALPLHAPSRPFVLYPSLGGILQISEITDPMWPSIMKIQDEAYALIAPESLDVLRSKWLASPNTCLVGLADEARIAGYLLSHPWQADSPPPLYEKVLPRSDSTTLYLHDLAVSKNARGTGLARSLFQTLRDKSVSAGYQTLELISIQNAIGFWTNMGFSLDTGVSLPESYGNGAAFMRLSLR